MLPNFGVNFLVQIASECLFYWVMPLKCLKIIWRCLCNALALQALVGPRLAPPLSTAVYEHTEQDMAGVHQGMASRDSKITKLPSKALVSKKISKTFLNSLKIP